MKCILVIVFSFFIAFANAQTPAEPNLNDVVVECMRTGTNLPGRQLVIWFPYDIWQIIGKQKKLSPESIRTLSDNMKDYLMFCVVDYTQAGTSISFKSEEDIRKTFVLTDSSGHTMKLLENEEIAPLASQMITNLQPIMAQLLGQFGEGMRIFLFKVKQQNGQPVINVHTKNNFSLSWDAVQLNWKLPVASMLPPKFCPVDKEQMKGTWYYCPVHGVKLDK